MSDSERRERGDGYLYQRGRIWWLGHYHHGRYLRESLGTSDFQKAKRLRRNKMKLANTPHFVPPDQQRLTFDDLAALYLADFQNNGRRSLRETKRIVEQLRSTFGTDKALAITADRIEAYKAARLQEGQAKATVNRQLSALRRMFSLAVKRELLTWRPVITMLDESDNVREGFIEPADFEAFCEVLPAVVADAARFAYLTLWRRENVLGLIWPWVTPEWTDGEISGGVIRLPGQFTKNGRPLTVVLRGRLLDIIRRRWVARVDRCAHVFHRNGKPLRDFRGAWENAAQTVGLVGCKFHDLRRSGARNLRRAGVPETVIMKMGAWRTRAMFVRYDIVSDDDLAHATDTYNQFLDGKHARKVGSLSVAREKRVPQPNTHNPRTVSASPAPTTDEQIGATA